MLDPPVHEYVDQLSNRRVVVRFLARVHHSGEYVPGESARITYPDAFVFQCILPIPAFVLIFPTRRRSYLIPIFVRSSTMDWQIRRLDGRCKLQLHWSRCEARFRGVNNEASVCSCAGFFHLLSAIGFENIVFLSRVFFFGLLFSFFFHQN